MDIPRRSPTKRKSKTPKKTTPGLKKLYRTRHQLDDITNGLFSVGDRGCCF